MNNGMLYRGRDGSYSCAYCLFLRENPVFISLKSGKMDLHVNGKAMGISVEGCEYDRKDLRYTENYSEINGHDFDAWKTPCNVFDSDVENLIQSGQLDRYRVDHSRSFPEIKKVVLDNDYTKLRIKKKRSSFSKMSLIIRNWMRQN